MKKIFILLYTIGLLVMSGCQQEEFIDSNLPTQTVKPGDRVKLDFSLMTSDFNIVTTRMTTEQENQWDKVWVAQFDSVGNRVGSITSYPKDAEKIDIIAEKGENTLYFITNVDNNPYTKGASEVSNLTDLEESIYTISDLTYFDTASKLVMVGVWKGRLIEDYKDPNDDTKLILKEIVVYAKRLTSKINIIVEASLPNVSFLNKKIRVEKIQLCAAPLKAFYKPANSLTITSADDVKDFEAEVFTEPDDGVMTYRSKPYYVLENMQGVKEHNGGAAMKGKYAPKDDGKDLATYVKIRAYIEDGLSTGFVDYRVYLGKNADKDFNIERNYHYTITIKIQGKGPDEITADFRVESRDDLYQIQLQTPDGKPATNRGSEVQSFDGNKEYWGWEGAESAGSKDHLRLFTNGMEWTLDTLYYSTSPSNSAYVWNNLYLEYSTTGDVWHKVIKGEGAPSNAKIRLRTGANNSSYDRTATFRFKLLNVENSATREWRVSQFKADNAFNVPPNSFFPGDAGTYAIAIRSEGATAWKFESKTVADSRLKFIGTVGADGFSSDPAVWQIGHGAVLFQVNARGNFTNQYVHASLGTVTMSYKASTEATETLTAETKLYQLATIPNLLNTIGATTGYRFAYEYSSAPMFTTVVAFGSSTPWAINMLDGEDTKYDDNKGLVGTTSPVAGKENTLQMFKLMDKKAAASLSLVPSDINVKGTPIFSPAGMCMSLNENYWEIEDANDSRLQWYLPSRNEGLMDVFVAMLKLDNGGTGTGTNIWTSTVPASTTKNQSAYFAGAGVDISANFSVNSTVRCIRKKTGDQLPSLTYPHLRNEAGTPVIVVREDGKGFVDRYRAKPANLVGNRYYNISYPLRYTSPRSDPARDGNGPIGTLELTMSPKFQVAKRDVTGTAVWHVASGWAGNLNFKEVADPATGCQSYTEAGEGGTVYDDWRLPTEMELRLIGLLGGGTGAGPAQDYILQNGGVNFTDIPGFQLMSKEYWTGSEYITSSETNERATYVTIYDLKNTDSPIRGTATARSNTYKIRCVRDIGRNSQ